MFLPKELIKEVKGIDNLSSSLPTIKKRLEQYIKNTDDFVRQIDFKEKENTNRKIILIEDEDFKNILKSLQNYFYNDWYREHIPNSVHGFIKGKSILTNAEQHTNKNIVLNIDIRSFFDCITIKKVEQGLLNIGLNDSSASIFASLCTFKNSLPVGFPTSPILSNIAFLKLDKKIHDFAIQNNITYTRYVDDITLSSNQEIVPKVKAIKKILNSYDFNLNYKKNVVYRRGGPQYVTGILVNNEEPRLPKKFRRSLEQELYYIERYGFRSHLDEASNPSKFTKIAEIASIFKSASALHGFLGYIKMIEPNLAKRAYEVLSNDDTYFGLSEV